MRTTHLSIRISLVGSIELFRDAVLDDPRLGPMRPPPPLMGVMLNEKDIVGGSKGTQREEVELSTAAGR